MFDSAIWKVSLALIFGLIGFFLSFQIFPQNQATLIAILVILVTLWTNEGLHLGYVSLLPLVLFPVFGVAEFNDVSSNYSKSILFLFMGGFLLAMGMQKSGAHEKVAHVVLSLFPKSFIGILYALSITSGLMSGVLSNTTVTILLVPIALYLSKDPNIQFRMVLAVAYGATVGGILTPIGTPPNLIYLGFAEDYALQVPSFFEWIFKLLPLVTFMMVIMPLVLSIGVKNFQIEDFKQKEGYTSQQKKILIILSLLVITLFINSPIRPFYNGLGIDEKLLIFATGLALFLPKIDILDWEDMRDFPYAIIFLFGASFSIAMAFNDTGLAKSVTEYLSIFSTLPTLLMVFILVATIIFATEVTSNTALISIALPVIFTFINSNNIENGETILFMLTIASSYAFMLPIATPPNAVAISTGVVKIRTMAKIGLILNLIGLFALVFIGEYIWK
jgi:sodium-dependent dicarboxylate transporter 2/3/5